MKKLMTPREVQDESTENAVNLAIIATDIKYIKQEVRDISDRLDKDYVTQDEFDPVKRIVYGMVSVVLLAVLGAVVALVLTR
jgi:hypothetical protein